MADKKNPITLRVIVTLLLVIVVVPLLPMILSGDWGWPEAWLYAVTSILTFIISRVIAGRRHPDLIAERGRMLNVPDTKPWDKVLAPLLGFGAVVMMATAGEEHAFVDAPVFSTGVKAFSYLMILLGYAFSSWALVENRFFSGTARIQSERGQHVVSAGPYRIVRHPGYAGALLAYPFIPFLFDSVWTFIPALLLVVVIVVRTGLEDRMLQAELPGYREFAARTRYRLLPGVW